MRIRKILIILTILIIYIPLISSFITIKIDVQPQFMINETISFNYSIISDVNEEISYVASINCPNAPHALLDLRSTGLISNIPLEEEYVYYSHLRDDIEPQVCNASVTILTPEEKTLQKTFEIKTNPSFSFDIVLDKKIFILKDVIKIDYSSELLSPTISSTLTFPDKTTKQITLSYSFKPSQLGTYEIETIASKEGYKTITKKEQFGVIEKEANIPYDSEITFEKLEKDFKRGKKSKEWIISLFFLIILIIILSFFFFYKKK